MSYDVFDNFLSDAEFSTLQSLVVGNSRFNWNITSTVSSDRDTAEENWNWYGFHNLYSARPLSEHYNIIDSIFCGKFNLQTWIRIKVNFYPYTSEIKEHKQHRDLPYSHFGAVFHLNTCDGFTRMPNGDKVDSVANRIVFFDPAEYHNSSTTSNQKGRYNINFNWL